MFSCFFSGIVTPGSFSVSVSQGKNQLVLKCAEEEEAKKLHSMIDRELANCGEVRVEIEEPAADIEEEAWYQEFTATLDEKPANYKLVHSDRGFHYYTRHVQTKVSSWAMLFYSLLTKEAGVS